MDYNKILQSKTIQDIYNKNPNRSSIATTASATSTGQSLEINIYREDGRLRHHSGTRASTTDSFDLNNPDSPGYKSSLQFKHQADNKEEEDPNLLSPSPFLPDDDWASACDGSIHDSDDEEGTFHSAISVQCLHQLDDEEDLISSDSSEECRRYMANLVDRLYNERETISPDEKATFLFWCKGGSGRGWFAYYVDSKRAEYKRVSEKSFNQLVTYFTLVLLECKTIGDFYPAKLLLQMCFTFYHEYTLRRAKHREYLYEALRSHPIWTQLGFWNATFLHAVHKERAYRSPVPIAVWSQLSNEERKELEMCDKNIAFGQLGSLTMNMVRLGLSVEFVTEFAKKMAIISNLDFEQLEMLEESIKNMAINEKKSINQSNR